MLRFVAFLVVWSGCAAPVDPGASGEGGPEAGAPVGRPAGAAPDGAWLARVSGRMAAEARAIRPEGDGFVAEIDGAGLAVGFDGAGLVVGEGGREPLRVGTVAWGRPGAVGRFEAEPFALGGCGAATDVRGACIPRLERAGSGLVEWWDARADGVQQGWTVWAAPPGEGALRFDVGLDGAEGIVVEADRAAFVDASGRAWRVGGVAAWDATGAALPAWLEAADAGLAVRVDDRDAAYPIEVDPIYSTAAWTYSFGEPTGANFGQELAAADVNGDGYEDLLLGSPNYRTRTGRVYVFHGGPTGAAETASAALTGEESYTRFGFSVAGGGDVDGDGYEDVVVGAYEYDYSSGRAYIFHGSAAGLGTAPATTLTAENPSDQFGYDVAAAGDVNGDGYDDVAVGAWAWSGSQGRLYVYYGSSVGVDTTPSTVDGVGQLGLSVDGAGDVDGDGYDDVISGGYSGGAYVYRGSAAGLDPTVAATLEAYASSVAGIGDVNGDGYADVAVAVASAGSYAGNVFVYEGSAAGVTTPAADTFTGPAAYTFFGSAIAGGGDLNGDGYDELVVSGYSPTLDPGAVYVYRGGRRGLSSRSVTTMTSADGGDAFGGALAGVGDVDGDGFDDLLVGSGGWDADRGRAELFPGSAAGVSSTAAGTWEGVRDPGGSVAAAGDVNGDGYGDVLVGAPGWDVDTGRAWVFHGSAAGLSETADATLDGESEYSYFGFALTSAGDVDADGFDDVAVGAYGYASETGRVYVFHGSAAGVSSTATTTLEGAGTSAGFGFSVADAGDVDGDGYRDLVVGAHLEAMRGGRAYVFHGSASGLATTATTTVSGLPSTTLGAAVAGVGDVDGDGHDDVAITTLYGGPAGEGAVDVYHGSPTGMATSATTSLVGLGAGDSFGGALAGAGDVNGDGYADVVVGAPLWSGERGAAYVFVGSSSGVSTTAFATVEGGAAEDLAGVSVAGAGDLDGDGYGDVIVGASGAGGATGEATVYAGSAAGMTPLATFSGTDEYDYLGRRVAGAGDVDGDGYGEVLVGTAVGRASLYRGYADHDGDGVAAAEDCDDADATVFPGAAEIAGDGRDQDCDGVDAGLPDTGADSGGAGDSAEDTGLPADTSGPGDSGDTDTGAPVDTSGPGDSGGTDTRVSVDTGGPGDSGDTDTGAPVDTSGPGDSGDSDTGVSVDTSGPGDSRDTETGVSEDTGGDTDTDTALDTDTAADTDTGSATDTDTGSATDTDTGSAVDTDTGSARDTDTGSAVDTDPDTDTAPDADTEGADSRSAGRVGGGGGCSGCGTGGADAGAVLALAAGILAIRRRAAR